MARMKKVLIVEDSTLLSRVLRDTFSKVTNLEVVGVAMSSKEAWELFQKTRPDVVSLDLLLPDGSGFDLLKRIMKERPTPVVIISSMTGETARETFKAYEMGAADVIEKPKNVLDPTAKVALSRMGSRVLRSADANINVLRDLALNKEGPKKELKKIDQSNRPAKKIILIASSTGGPQILTQMMPRFGNLKSIGIVIVQHIPAFFSATLAQRLDRLCPYKVREAVNGEVVKEGTCLVATGGVHLEASVDKKGVIRVNTTNGPLVKGVRPSADITFRSFAEYVDLPTVGIVLTGMGSDGTDGVVALKKKGVKIISQSKETCVVYGMPRSVEEMGLSNHVLSHLDIPKKAKKIIDQG